MIFFHCNSQNKQTNKQKYAVPQGITLASLLSTCDFHLKMNTIQNKQNVVSKCDDLRSKVHARLTSLLNTVACTQI
jgi:hypothetical protein